MQGPALTPKEAVALVARRVCRLESHGLARELAVQAAATEFGLDAHKVLWCVNQTAAKTEQSKDAGLGQCYARPNPRTPECEGLQPPRRRRDQAGISPSRIATAMA
jgi:hypothetical protein